MDNQQPGDITNAPQSVLLVYKRCGDGFRPIYSERPLKRPLLALLLGWLADFILEQRPIPEQPDVLTYYRISNDKPNTIAGDVELELWKEYVNSYNTFRTLEKEVGINIKTNERLLGKPIGHSPTQGTIYEPVNAQ